MSVSKTSPFRSVTSVLVAAAMLIVPACKPGKNAASAMTSAPTMESAGQARCGVKSSASKPLIVEWPAAERAALEGRANNGLVAVRFSGCEMEVLTTCEVTTGAYNYTGLTAKTETVRITSADELYANMPVGAAKLEAKLETYGELAVDMTIIGRKEADRYEFAPGDLSGRCDEATHVITGLTVGAFTFATGSGAEVAGGASVGNAGAGAASSAEREVLNTDGNVAACQAATAEDMTPPPGCGALLRVEVVPVDRPAPPVGADGEPATPIAATPDEVEKTDRQLKTLQWTYLGAYLGGLGLLGVAVYGGVSLRSTAETELAESRNDPTADRASLINKRKTAIGLLYGAGGGGVALLLVGLWANAKHSKLKAKRARMSGFGVTPLVEGGAMAGVEVSF